MKASYSHKTDTLYLLLEEGRSVLSKELGGGVRVEINDKGDVVGINIRNVRNSILPVLGVRVGEPAPLPELEKKSPIKIRIDRDSCLGFASCVSVAPRVFQLDEQTDTERKSFFLSRAKIEVLDETAEDYDTILRAAQACPTKAIILEERETGEQIYP